MDCNRDEAVRAKELAEKKFAEKDFGGAKHFALKAQNLYPPLDGLNQLMETLKVYIAGEERIDGEHDWYGILGVEPLADQFTIRKQFRKLALSLHPDKNKSMGAEGAFKLVCEAWNFLSDKGKRILYDQNRRNKPFQNGQESSSVPAGRDVSNSFTGNSSKVKPNHCNSIPVERPPSVPPSFWTTCATCKMHYEYLRIYLNHKLECGQCKKSFMATETPSPLVDGNLSNSRNSNKHQKRSSQNAMAGNSYARGRSMFSSHKFSSEHFKSGNTANMSAQTSPISRDAGVAAQAAFEQSKRLSEEVPTNLNSGDALRMKTNGQRGRSQVGKLNMKMLIYKAQTEIRKKLVVSYGAVASEVPDNDMGKDKGKEGNDINGCETDGNKSKKSVDMKPDIEIKETSFTNSGDNPGKEETILPTMIVPDPDFHDFDHDRTERSFGENQVWAAYDDDDGMPRYYAMIHGVVSLKPFKMRISWLRSKSNDELAPINWISCGFYKICGDFRIGKHEINKSLNSFSHRVKWAKGKKGVIQIYPKEGDVWALYRHWSRDWTERTPNDVVHKYNMVEVLSNYNEDSGVLVAPLVKVAGYKTVFRRHPEESKRRVFPKEELFRFSHQVSSYLLTGQEGHIDLKGCLELDPAAMPLELLQVLNGAQVNELEIAKENNITAIEEETNKPMPTETTVAAADVTTNGKEETELIVYKRRRVGKQNV